MYALGRLTSKVEQQTVDDKLQYLHRRKMLLPLRPKGVKYDIWATR